MRKALTPMVEGKFAAVVVNSKHYIRMVHHNLENGLYIVIDGKVHSASQFKFI